MVEIQTVSDLKKRMFKMANYSGDIHVCYQVQNMLNIRHTENTLVVQAPDLSGLARGLFQAALALKEGKPVPPLNQERHFQSCGAMLDLSRGGVLTVDALKRYIDCQAAIGLNMLMLYLEDMYPIEEYPYFGYLRGRYSMEELHEIDAYAVSAGIELIPCIQTLGHLAQFLQWKDSEELRDTSGCLLVEEEKTYQFIEAELNAVRQCFSSDRIHIGMDEAYGIGLGAYFEKHGVVDRYKLLNEHLNRVVAMCKQKELRPIMWSDMFYRFASASNNYYDLEAEIPQSVIEGIPDVEMCYWDYYHTDQAFYEKMLDHHRRMKKEVVFAGGNWTWSGFLPQVKTTNETMYPALRACLKQKVKTVMATQWGDDGHETDYFLALSQMTIFSEFCWLGEQCTQQAVEQMGTALTGLSKETYAAFGALHPSAKNERPGKGLFYCDLLYPMLYGLWDLTGYAESLQEALDILEPQKGDERCAYAYCVILIVLKKLCIIRELMPAYHSADRECVRLLAKKLPELYEDYERFLDIWREQWEKDKKRFGWEIDCMRIGGILTRLKDVQRILMRWVEQEIESIEELEEKPLRAARGPEYYYSFVSPQFR